MPTTIQDSDLAFAEVEGGRLALHYTGASVPPAYFLRRCDAAGRETRRSGPFEDEDQALDAARQRYGSLEWGAH